MKILKDFISTSKGNFPVAFDLGMENLKDIMSVIDEYFTNQDCEDFVDQCKQRIKFLKMLSM